MFAGSLGSVLASMRNIMLLSHSIHNWLLLLKSINARKCPDYISAFMCKYIRYRIAVVTQIATALIGWLNSQAA
jgi:hypothetical protein